MANVLIQSSTLTGIADAIRAKDGSTAQMYPSEMAGKIDGVYEKGKTDGLSVTSDATASKSNILSGKTAYVNGVKIKGSAAICGNSVSASGGNSHYCYPGKITVSGTNTLTLTVNYYKSGWNTTTITIKIS